MFTAVFGILSLLSSPLLANTTDGRGQEPSRLLLQALASHAPRWGVEAPPAPQFEAGVQSAQLRSRCGVPTSKREQSLTSTAL